MSHRPLTRRRRPIQVSVKQIVLAAIVIGVFLLLITMLGQANKPG
ncbi:hypothetical protein [Sphingomonas sp.]|nr:hypothetical protein [Sphingomonas sp.]